MSSTLSTLLRRVAFGLALVASGSSLSAQSIGGVLFDGAGGPVTPGVHIVTNHITVPAGETLTLQPGAILKFSGTQITASGVLHASGTALNPVILTSIHDDTAGGDTNGNGSGSAPAPDQWQGVVLNAGAAGSVLDHVDIRYTGSGGWSGIYVNQPGANFTLSNSTIRSGSHSAIDAANQVVATTVTNCNFVGNSLAAVANLRLDSVPGFTNNTASGNGGNYMQVTTAPVDSPLSIAATNCLNGALVLTTHISIASGKSLTLQAGTVLKWTGNLALAASGQLFVNGTSGQPVVLTSIHDDSIAGDTNNNGSGSAPAPDQWQGVVLNAGAAGSVLDHVDIRYTGSAGYSGIYVNQAGAHFTLKNSTIRSGSHSAIDAANQVVTATVTNCSFVGNSLAAIANLRLDSVPGFSANTASGNGGNYMQVTTAPVDSPLSIAATNCLNGALVLTTHISIAGGKSLTLQAGTVLKWTGNLALAASGQLFVNGTSAQPVVLTSIHDDSIAGDTNNNGNGSAPAPDQWQGVVLNAGSAGSVLDHVDIRYTGSAGYSGIYVNQAGAHFTLKNSTIRSSSHSAIDAANQVVTSTVSNCNFVGNSLAAVANLRLDSVPGFSANAASGNGGNYMQVTSAGIDTYVPITETNCLQGSLVLASNVSVNPGGTLQLGPRVHVKFTGNLQLTVNGSLDVQGTADAPVIITSIHDDSVDGDTNNNSNGSVGGKDQWQGIVVNAGASASTLNHLVLRYTGSSGWAGLTSSSPLLSAHLVRSEHSSHEGFLLNALASPGTDLTAWDCDTGGFVLPGGSFLLKRCTAANNAGSGFRRTAGFTGTIRSSISQGNGGGGNFDGFAAGSVFFSDGSAALAGSNGNLNADPLFVNAAAGNFTLQKLSPCVDSGDPSDFAFGLDQSGYPRYMDGKLNGAKVVDMGAYEFDHVHLAVTGTPTPGGTITVTTTGTAGLSTYMFIGVVQAEVPLKQFGPLFMNINFPNVLLAWLPTPSSLPIGIPLDLPTPLPLIFQELGLQANMSNSPGNLSNPVYVTLK